MVLPVVAYGHPVLKKVAKEIDPSFPNLKEFITDMFDTMYQSDGVGLAAPQVNVPLRIVVVEFGSEEDEEAPKKLYTVINPEITRPSTETVLGTEGCLSVPGIVGEVERAESLTVKGLSRRGQPITIKAKGWLARIFQHEIDHLDGILFVDRAEKLWKTEEQQGQVMPEKV